MVIMYKNRLLCIITNYVIKSWHIYSMHFSPCIAFEASSHWTISIDQKPRWSYATASYTKKTWSHIVPILPPPPHDGPGKQWGRENPEQSASITPPLSCKNIRCCTTYNSATMLHRSPPPRRQGGEQVGMRELSSFIHNSRAGGGTSCPPCLALSLNHNLQQFISSTPQDITLFTCSSSSFDDMPWKSSKNLVCRSHNGVRHIW